MDDEQLCLALGIDPEDGSALVEPKVDQEVVEDNKRAYAIDKALWIKSVSHENDIRPMTTEECIDLASKVLNFLNTGTVPQKTELNVIPFKRK